MAIKGQFLIQDTALQRRLKIPLMYLNLDDKGKTKSGFEDVSVFYKFERAYLVTKMSGACACLVC
jgi:hypothetical protein